MIFFFLEIEPKDIILVEQIGFGSSAGKVYKASWIGEDIILKFPSITKESDANLFLQECKTM